MSIAGLHRIPGIRVGHATDPVGLTGCTAIVFPEGAVAGHVTAGVATGSRELAALEPRHLVERVHAICLAGGSAFGLAAASGVARVLEEAGIGHLTSCARVPIVAAAVVYDLALGDPRARPDEAMGAAAARLALLEPARRGRSPATSAPAPASRAGKLLGIACATKTGLGVAGLDAGDGLLVGALVVLNPVGDVLGPDGKVPGRHPARAGLAGAGGSQRAHPVRRGPKPARAGHQHHPGRGRLQRPGEPRRGRLAGRAGAGRPGPPHRPALHAPRRRSGLRGVGGRQARGAAPAGHPLPRRARGRASSTPARARPRPAGCRRVTPALRVLLIPALTCPAQLRRHA